MSYMETARKLRQAIITASEHLDDKTASTAALLFPRLKQDGVLIKAGARINWNGTVKRAAVDLWDTAENTPDNAPEIWEDILYREGFRIIPETLTVTTAFSAGEYGWWGDTLYRSKVDSNVYTPEQYAANWEAASA